MTIDEQMVSIVKEVINNEIPKTVVTDWDKLLQLADFHCVSMLMAYAVNDSTPELIRKKLHSTVTLNVFRMTKLEYETKAIFEEFEKNHVSYMPLKGYIIKNLYPTPEMRTMGDIDILIKASDTEKIDQIMLMLGYSNANLRLDDEITYYKSPLIKYEMHISLVSKEHSKIYSYYENVWRLAKKDEHNNYGYHMCNEDFFIFMLAHFTKHYTNAGIGLRAIIDIYLYLKMYRESLDWKYIDEELDKLRFKEFAYNIFDLADFWFGNGKETQTTNAIAEFVLGCGIYGSTVNRLAVKKMCADNRFFHSIRYNFASFFLNSVAMRKLYPKLVKFPWLIWYYWIKRAIIKCFSASGRGFVKEQIEASSRINKSLVHFQQVGLWEFLKGKM